MFLFLWGRSEKGVVGRRKTRGVYRSPGEYHYAQFASDDALSTSSYVP